MVESVKQLVEDVNDAVGTLDLRPVRVMGQCGNLFEIGSVYVNDEGVLVLELD